MVLFFFLIYDVEFISAVQQSEIALCVCIPPLSCASLPPLHPSPLGHSEHQAELPVVCGNFSVSAAYHPDHDLSFFLGLRPRGPLVAFFSPHLTLHHKG